MDLFQWRVVWWGVKVASEGHSNERANNWMFSRAKYFLLALIQIVEFNLQFKGSDVSQNSIKGSVHFQEFVLMVSDLPLSQWQCGSLCVTYCTVYRILQVWLLWVIHCRLYGSLTLYYATGQVVTTLWHQQVNRHLSRLESHPVTLTCWCEEIASFQSC